MSEENQSNAFVPADWIDDDSALKMVRQTRLAINDKILANGIPVDPEGFEILHKNLVEIDKGAFKSKQLKQEEKSSEATARLAMEISNQLARNMGGNKMFQAQDPIDVGDVPAPTHLIGVTTPAPGELNTGDDTSSYEVFNETVGKALDEARRGSGEDDV